MKIIYKYTEQFSDKVTLALPRFHKILDVGIQEKDENIIFCAWAIVEANHNPETQKTFYVFGTGQGIKSELSIHYIKTIQKDDLVWHIFEELV